MFGVDTSELFIVVLAALIFIGPKELPSAMRSIGRWVGKARAHARHFTAGIENMMREAELEEMEKRWREENERIMREHPMSAVPYAGAIDPSPSFATSVADPASPSDREVGTPPGQSLDDEPSLPLPEPGHHQRDLP